MSHTDVSQATKSPCWKAIQEYSSDLLSQICHSSYYIQNLEVEFLGLWNEEGGG